MIKKNKKIAQKEKKEMQKASSNGSEFEKLRFVLMTEKAVQLIENQNKITFIVNRKVDKQEIKEAVESAFQSKVKDVRVMIDQEGRKKALVKFEQAGAAGEIAIKLGII